MKKHYITKIVLWTATILITLTAIAHATPAMQITAASYGLASQESPLMTAFNAYNRTYTVHVHTSSGIPTTCAVYQITAEHGMELVGITYDADFAITVQGSATEILACWPRWGEDFVFMGIR
jgi:hypothetical protein